MDSQGRNTVRKTGVVCVPVYPVQLQCTGTQYATARSAPLAVPTEYASFKEESRPQQDLQSRGYAGDACLVLTERGLVSL